MGEGIEAVKSAFASGLPVLIFDSEMREGETDLLFPALHVQPTQIRQLRQVCGGLLFLVRCGRRGNGARESSELRFRITNSGPREPGLWLVRRLLR